MPLQQHIHVLVQFQMGLDLNTLSDADPAWIIEGAPDYATICEAVPQTDLQWEPMGIGDIAAVR
eukprot:5549423-Heterocapsa_arctica.AAC.1